MRSPTYCAVRIVNRQSPALSPELRRWTDTLLDPEVWEHSSDYKPPPANAVTTISTFALRSVSTAVTAPATPVASPIPDSESVGFAATAEPTVYVSIRWDDRKFYVLDPEDEDEFSADPYLCTADALSITNERLLAFFRLEKRLEELQQRYDDARSYLDSAPDPEEFRGRGIDRAERLYLQQRYEAAIAEEADLDNTLGRALAECEAEYQNAKSALVLDIFGPAPVYEPSNTVYFTLASDGSSIGEICGTARSILENLPPHAEAHEYFRGLYTTLTADLPVTNARLLEVWEAPAADKPALLAAVLADIAARQAAGSSW